MSVDMQAVRDRYQLARMAGEAAIDAGQGWDENKIQAIVNSWQDVAPLHDALKQCMESGVVKGE